MIDATALHLIESTVFAALIAALAFVCRRRGASTRYALWFTAAVKFAVPAALWTDLGIRMQPLLPDTYSAIASAAPFPFLAAAEMSTVSTRSSPIVSVIHILWLAGIVLMLAVWIRRSFALRSVSNCPPGAGQDALDRMRIQLGIRRNVRLRASAEAGTPLALTGIWRPVIELPLGLSSQLTPPELDAVLLHELGHVRRWDNLSAAFVHTVVCIFWFHPLLWWLERRLILERERACDELVMGGGVKPETYISGILKVCRFQLADTVAGISGIGGSDLKSRMELIMSNNVSNTTSRAPRLLLASIAAVMTVLPFVAGFLHQSALQAQTQPAPGRGCMFADVAYPSGTVLKMGRQATAPAKECVAGAWAQTKKPVTKVRDEPPPFVCNPAPSTSDRACACQFGNSFSLGAIVNSPNGKLRCDKFVLGQQTAWRLATPAELGGK